MPPKTKTPMTDEHKAALAAGRAEGRSVKQYLEALESNRPKRGRKRTPESIGKRLETIEADLADADGLKRLNLVQERLDLQNELERLNSDDTVDLSALEAEFVKVAKGYGERKGISYAAWREVGVPAPVLKQAGISRGAA
jgi:uncharacterized protein YicC (UPF0701 family)